MKNIFKNIDSDSKEFITNTFYLYLLQAFNYILPFLTLPYLLVTLSAAHFGIYSFTFAFSQFIVLVVDFGFNLTATKEIAENSANEEVVKGIFWRVLVIKTIFMIVAFFVTLIILFFFDKLSVYKTGIFWSFLMIAGTVLFPVWWFQGMNRVKIMTLISGVSKIAVYPFFFILVKDKNDSTEAVIIQSLAFLVTGVVSLFYILYTLPGYRLRKRVSISRYDLKKDLKLALPIFLSNFSTNLYTNSLTVILGFFSSPVVVGYFGALERIVRIICNTVLGPLNQACFPLLVQLKTVNFPKAKHLYGRILLLIGFLLLLIVSSVILFSGFFEAKFFKGYTYSINYFYIFLLMVFPIVLGGVVGQLGLLALGGEEQKKIFSRIYIVTGLLSLPFSLCLIYSYRLEGAIASVIIVEMCIFILLFYWTYRFSYYKKSL